MKYVMLLSISVVLHAYSHNNQSESEYSSTGELSSESRALRDEIDHRLTIPAELYRSGGWNNVGYRMSPNPRPRVYYWMNIGVGVATTGIAVAGNLSLHWDMNIVSLRGSAVDNILEYETMWDVGLLYGQALSGRTKFAIASFGVGISVVGSEDGWGGVDRSLTVGIPIEVQLFLRDRHSGLGVYGFGNINPERIFVGVTVSLQVGRLR
jgi:hypothetical protein